MPFTCRHGTVHRDVWPEYGQSRRDVTLQEQSMMDLPSTPSLRNQGVA
jgi:hypothetical protein